MITQFINRTVCIMSSVAVYVFIMGGLAFVAVALMQLVDFSEWREVFRLKRKRRHLQRALAWQVKEIRSRT